VETVLYPHTLLEGLDVLFEHVREVQDLLRAKKHLVYDLGWHGWFRVYLALERTSHPGPLSGDLLVGAVLTYRDLSAGEKDTAMDAIIAADQATGRLERLGARQARRVAIFLPLAGQTNYITGRGIGGYADRKDHAIAIDLGYISNRAFIIEALCHEWGHMWLFSAPKHVKDYFLAFYDYLRRGGPTARRLVLPVALDVRQEAKEAAWKAFSKSWEQHRGTDPETWVETWNSAVKDPLRILLRIAWRARGLSLYGKLKKRVAELRAGTLVRVLLNPDSPSVAGGYAAVFPVRSQKVGGEVPVQGNVDSVGEWLQIDVGQTEQKARQDLPELGIALIGLSATQGSVVGREDEVGPAHEFTREVSVDFAMEAASKALLGVLLTAGYVYGRGTPGSASVLYTGWMSRVPEEAKPFQGKHFDPKRTFFRVVDDAMGDWQPEVAADLAQPMFEPVRRKLHALGLFPSAYSASNVDELAADTIAYAAVRPNEVPPPVRRMLRNALQGDTDTSEARLAELFAPRRRQESTAMQHARPRRLHEWNYHVVQKSDIVRALTNHGFTYRHARRLMRRLGPQGLVGYLRGRAEEQSKRVRRQWDYACELCREWQHQQRMEHLLRQPSEDLHRLLRS
jgi:hypothetical protein